MTIKMATGVLVWTSYWGALLHDDNNKSNSIVYGFENESPANANNKQATTISTYNNATKRIIF